MDQHVKILVPCVTLAATNQQAHVCPVIMMVVPESHVRAVLFLVQVPAICHQEIALLVAVAIMEPNVSFPVGQDVLMHTVIGSLVLAPV